MCGICGAFRPKAPPPADRAVIEAMRATLNHRGPDDAGIFLDEHVGLGFRRLAIVDLATGNQPIANEDASLQLICNGEIYNAPDLRKGLAAQGHRFATLTDTEVILHLYEEYGTELVHYLNGQFSFALYDATRQRLFCARDPFGVSPFFHTMVRGAFVFGSEVKAILAYPGVVRHVDLTGLDQILSLPGLVSPRTMFTDIHSLPPGHSLVVDAKGVATRRYWDLDFPLAGDVPMDGNRNWQESLRESLAASVVRRMMADVPVGVYLSGGLDSSLITRLMADHSGDSLHSFSIRFGDQMFDEDQFQQIMVQATGTVHSTIHHPADRIETDLRRSILHSECPVKESYNTAALALSASASAAGVPVVQSGEGADELFAGYIGYRYDAFRALRGGQGPCAAEAALRAQSFGDAGIFYEKDLLDHENQRSNLYATDVRAQLEEFRFTNWSLVDAAQVQGRHPIHQRSYLDMKLRLADHLLGDHGDRMLMANSVEGRFPFLDVELIKLVRTIPADLLLRDFTEKYILKEAARPRLPPEIVGREKFAFVAPGSAHLLRCGGDWIAHLLSPETIRAQGYFEVEEVERLKRASLASDPLPTGGMPEDPLLTVLTFGIFLECFDMPALGPGGV